MARRTKPKRLGQRIKAHPFRVESGAVRERNGHAEGGIKTPAQVHTSDVLRLDHKTVAGTSWQALSM